MIDILTTESTNSEGLLELTHNYGTENDPEYKITNGNTDPHRGFGHLCMSVDNIELVCEKMEANGVKFQKRLTDGRRMFDALLLLRKEIN